MAKLDQIHNGKHWNARTIEERVVNGAIERKLELHVGWVNFLNAQGEWQEIDCNYVETPDGFEVTDAPFIFKAPKFADEMASFEANTRFDVQKKERIDDSSMIQTLKALDAAHVQGEIFDIDGNGRSDAILYPQAFPQWDADLIYFVHHGRAPRLKKLVRFNSAPPADLQVKFEIGYNRDGLIDKIEKSEVKAKGARIMKVDKTRWNGVGKLKTKDGLSVRAETAVSDMRGVGMKEFYIWDSGKYDFERKKQKIEVDFERKSARKYTLTKNVPAAFFEGALFPVYTDATSTFYPDPNTETTSVDGTVYSIQSGNSFANAHDGAGGGLGVDDSSTTSNTLADAAAGAGGYRLRKAFFLFDTSALTASASISAAVFSFAFDSLGGGGHNDTSQTYGLVQTNPASNTSLSTADYASGVVNLHSDTLGANTVAVNYSESAGVYADFTLDATGRSWISKTGITKLGIRRSPDYLSTTGHGTAPSGVTQSHREFRQAEYSGTGSDPKLVVTYTTAVDVNPTATVQVATFSIPAYTVSVIANPTVTPTTLSATFSIPTYAASANANVSVSTLSATFSIPTITVIAGDVAINASTLAATFSIPAYTVIPEVWVTVSPTTLSATFSIPSPAVDIGANIAATTLVSTFSIPTYTVSVTANPTVSATTLAATFSIPSSSVALGIDFPATTLGATFSLVTYTVTVTASPTIAASTLVATFSLPALDFVGGVWRKQPQATDEWDKIAIGE